MSRSFWFSFLVAALLTAVTVTAVGWVIGRLAAPPPREKFMSSTFEFEIPKGWECHAEGTETVCTAGDAGGKPHSAICILTMKYRGPQDTYDAYIDHLSRPKTTKDSDEKSVLSEVSMVERQQIAGYSWLHGRHYQSEIPRYYTDYYAALTSHIAILVTFSSHRDYVDRHRLEFAIMISTLRVQQDTFSAAAKATHR